MPKGTKLTWTQFQILAIIAKDKDKDGWYYYGSQHIADILSHDRDYIQDNLRQLIHDGILQVPKTPDPRRKHIPVQQTRKGYEERLGLFATLFPDLRRVLLTRG